MNDFMKLAVEEAEKGIASNEGGPFGCVIVKNGEVVGKGHNQVVKNKDSTCHGEMMAIRDACRKTGNFDLSGCELYTTGEPCPMCFGAILWANISKVFYGCNIKDTEKIGFRDRRFYEDSEKIKAELFEENGREECLELYRKYSQRVEKTNY
ncbi:MAG: nucleoside deaminase [Spirochaetia bacterium]|nr:nucleoside deaminase [Spirochaetia bacterium]